ncbi:hypothetical protein [Terriglobus roseus]|uniref:Uncharacterized protein n=1 Tax=Terriglobus roseus TaxID=392734 RepID=A0A1G7KTE7_9BACT|nr:hypothetical protein [Terriglobus roseus]SDF40493.1 hypothetical protein SAMN05444167_2303 [Terriglobus roseus]
MSIYFSAVLLLIRATLQFNAALHFHTLAYLLTDQELAACTYATAFVIMSIVNALARKNLLKISRRNRITLTVAFFVMVGAADILFAFEVSSAVAKHAMAVGIYLHHLQGTCFVATLLLLVLFEIVSEALETE